MNLPILSRNRDGQSTDQIDEMKRRLRDQILTRFIAPEQPPLVPANIDPLPLITRTPVVDVSEPPPPYDQSALSAITRGQVNPPEPQPNQFQTNDLSLITRSDPSATRPRLATITPPNDLSIGARRVDVDTAQAEPPRGGEVLTRSMTNEPAPLPLLTRGEPSNVLTRPERPLNEPFGSTGEVFGSARVRRTQPRDYIADDAQYLRDLENEPIVRNDRKRSAGLGALRGADAGPVGAGIGALIGLLRSKSYGEAKRDEKIGRAREQLGVDLGVEQQQGQTATARALAMERLSHAPDQSTRIGERRRIQ